MTRKETEQKKVRLDEILKEENITKKLENLQKLAKEVGDSVTRMEKVQTKHDIGGRFIYDTLNEITETEIVHNIQFSLQTETMIVMCKTAARNFWIALIASIIAFLSMIAAFMATLSK